MKAQRTTEQRRALLASRQAFNGTNIEFCAQHNICIASFHKHQANLRQSASSFVQVKTTNSAQAYANLYSIIETAKAKGITPFYYIMKCLNELWQPEPDIDSLLPWNIKL